MPLRKRQPVTAGLRHALLPDYSEITRQRPEKSLVRGIKRTGGRNNEGRVTARNTGGGHKRRYRTIDFIGRKGVDGKVATIEYDPNRTARIALVHYPDGRKTYMLAPDGLRPGFVIQCGSHAEVRTGNRLPLLNIPEGTSISNIELKAGRGGKMARSAGTFAMVMVRGETFAQVKLSSGEIRLIDLACMATVGQVSNVEHKYEVSGKAGRARWQGRKPHVRGVAMNPVDHPMGGGEGAGKGHQSQSPTGVPAKGYKTRRGKRPSDKFIMKRRGK